MGLNNFMSRADAITHRGLGDLGRPVAVGVITFTALDQGLPVLGMAIRGNPIVASVPVKAGVAVGVAGVVEGAFWLTQDAEVLDDRADAAKARWADRADAVRAKSEKAAAAAESKAAKKAEAKAVKEAAAVRAAAAKAVKEAAADAAAS